MTLLSNPHDHFFREVFSRREVAIDFVRHYLPPDIVAQLDLTTLHIAKDSFVDPELREHFADLLYQARLLSGQDAYIYVLFEHKSYPEAMAALQLLRYMVRIWGQVLKQGKPEHLPPIVPVLVYHGAENWQADERFQALFADLPALSKYIPDFRYQLCDLSEYNDDEIAGEVLLRVALLILKHIFAGDLRTRLPDILSLMTDLAQAKSGMEYLEIVLRYVTAAAIQLDTEDLQEAVSEAFPETGGALMTTIAQRWIEQGAKRGVLIEAREAVIDILKARFATISPVIETIIATLDDPLQLKELRKQAATATTLAEFEQALET